MLFRSGVDLPLEHPHAYASIVDEPGLDYMIVMEDLQAREADPLDATRPLTPEEVANGLVDWPDFIAAIGALSRKNLDCLGYNRSFQRRAGSSRCVGPLRQPWSNRVT